MTRLLRRTTSQQVVRNGTIESRRQVFFRESIIVWHFQSFARKRARIRA